MKSQWRDDSKVRIRVVATLLSQAANLAIDNVLTWGLAGSTGHSIMLIASLVRSRFEPFGRLQQRAAEPHIRSLHGAADTKIPRTRGHGSGGWDQSLWRHLAARTLRGPPTKIRRGIPSWML